MLAILLIAVGVIWILQGINVLPGSFMTGQIQWANRGGIAAVGQRRGLDRYRLKGLEPASRLMGLD
jgi:uncharacterized membrane protein YphA (DoxX/SURF4 family)